MYVDQPEYMDQSRKLNTCRSNYIGMECLVIDYLNIFEDFN